MKRPLVSHSLAIVAGVLAACLAVESRGQTVHAGVRSDIVLARGLASDLHYFDLAEEVLASADGKEMPATLREELDLAKCHVKAERATIQESHAFGHELHEQAMVAYREYLEEHQLSIHLRDAQIAYVEFCNVYSKELGHLCEVTVGPEAQEVRKRIEGLLEDAVRVNRELVDVFKIRTSHPSLAERRRLFSLELNLAQMLHTLGRVSERGDLLREAEQILSG